MKKLALLMAFMFLLAAAPIPAAEVKNTVSRQVGNRVQFTYDLIGSEATADVDVTLTIQGRAQKASELHLDGDYGKVAPGSGKIVYWNVLLDYPRGLDADVAWKIDAARMAAIEGNWHRPNGNRIYKISKQNSADGRYQFVGTCITGQSPWLNLTQLKMNHDSGKRYAGTSLWIGGSNEFREGSMVIELIDDNTIRYRTSSPFTVENLDETWSRVR